MDYEPAQELLQGDQLREEESTDGEFERQLSEQHQLMQRLQQENKELQNSVQLAKIEV